MIHSINPAQTSSVMVPSDSYTENMKEAMTQILEFFAISEKLSKEFPLLQEMLTDAATKPFTEEVYAQYRTQIFDGSFSLEDKKNILLIYIRGCLGYYLDSADYEILIKDDSVIEPVWTQFCNQFGMGESAVDSQQERLAALCEDLFEQTIDEDGQVYYNIYPALTRICQENGITNPSESDLQQAMLIVYQAYGIDVDRLGRKEGHLPYYEEMCCISELFKSMTILDHRNDCEIAVNDLEDLDRILGSYAESMGEMTSLDFSSVRDWPVDPGKSEYYEAKLALVVVTMTCMQNILKASALSEAKYDMEQALQFLGGFYANFIVNELQDHNPDYPACFAMECIQGAVEGVEEEAMSYLPPSSMRV